MSDVVVGITRRIAIDGKDVEDLCYSLYAAFRWIAQTIAIDRVTCSKIIVMGKGFELRMFVNLEGIGAVTAIATLNRASEVDEFAAKVLTPLDGVLSRCSVRHLESAVRVFARTTARPKTFKIRDLVTRLEKAGVAIRYTDEKELEGGIVVTIGGVLISKDLRRCNVVLSASTSISGFSNLEIAVEAAAKPAEVGSSMRDLYYAASLLRCIVEAQSVELCMSGHWQRP